MLVVGVDVSVILVMPLFFEFRCCVSMLVDVLLLVVVAAAFHIVMAVLLGLLACSTRSSLIMSILLCLVVVTLWLLLVILLSCSAVLFASVVVCPMFHLFSAAPPSCFLMSIVIRRQDCQFLGIFGWGVGKPIFTTCPAWFMNVFEHSEQEIER